MNIYYLKKFRKLAKKKYYIEYNRYTKEYRLMGILSNSVSYGLTETKIEIIRAKHWDKNSPYSFEKDYKKLIGKYNQLINEHIKYLLSIEIKNKFKKIEI